MSGVKRTKTGIDVLEHALMGVHTSESPGKIVAFERKSGIVGMRAVVAVDVADDSPEEREVIVNLSGERPGRRSRRR
jgi:hypothetical protein